MDLPETSRLYSVAIAAAKFADERLEARTRADYNGSLRRFAEFCTTEGYLNPLNQRFVQLPAVIAAFINKLATTNTSQWPAEKRRAAISWHSTKPEMLSGSHPHDRWDVETAADGSLVPRGNPARSAAAIMQILAGLSKAKKRERTPKRASPMSPVVLSRMMAYLESSSTFNDTMRIWYSAVCSLAFYGMCRINEVLQMKKGNIQLGLQRRSRKNGATIKFGCFTIRDRKTDHDPLASRTYSLHVLPNEERAAEALTYLERWFAYSSTHLHHKWRDDHYAFPSLTNIPRGGARSGAKRRKCSKNVTTGGELFEYVGIKWGSPMSDSNFTQVLNIVADAAGISKSLMGDDILFTSHCFRRGGAQYRFMFAPEKSRWSLKLVKWWAGWAPSENSETVTRYLLDDVLDREENQLGDSLAPDALSCTEMSLQGLQNIDYISLSDDADASDADTSCGLPICKKVTLTESALSDLKNDLLERLREMVKDIAANQSSTHATVCEDPSQISAPLQTSATAEVIEVTSSLTSELPDAKSWRDCVNQYWHANPACHQYRAGIETLPHERKAHRSRLSRMKIIAEFIRENFGGDQDQFEADFSARVNGDLTVNKILTEIRRRRLALQ